MRFLTSIVLALVGLGPAAPRATAAPAIIPTPVVCEEREGSFTLAREVILRYADPAAKRSAERLARQLRGPTGFALPVRPGDQGAIVLEIIEDEALGAEGYELVVGDSVRIRAPGDAGLFYGIQSFRQLLPPDIYSTQAVSVPWLVPAVEIRDFPRFTWRGLHLDVSRHFMPKEDVMKLIDVMASLKLNTFHWHLTDDQGWRIQIRQYPRLTAVGAWRDETVVGHQRDKPRRYDGVRHGGYYTQDDIREVVAFAADRHITIVPEIDMPGHMRAAVAAYPELGCTGEEIGVCTEWGISPQILNPEESTVQFCKDVLTEVMELFPSEFIHIGGDEADKKLWEASDRIQHLRKERGLADMHELQSWFIRQIDDFLTANGRRLIGWDEIAEGGLADNAAIMWWRGKRGAETARNALTAQHDVVVACNSHLYFDYYQSRDKQNEPLAIGGFLPLDTVYHFEPVIEGLNEQDSKRILGAQGQLWSEYMPTIRQVEYMAFPRACALAEIVWSPRDKRNFASFLDRLQVQARRLDAADIRYRPSGNL